MTTFGLTPVAAFVLRSLVEHPDLRLPDAIAAGPDADPTLDTRAVSGALDELASHGLVEREPDGGWRVTEAGRAA